MRFKEKNDLDLERQIEFRWADWKWSEGKQQCYRRKRRYVPNENRVPCWREKGSKNENPRQIGHKIRQRSIDFLLWFAESSAEVLSRIWYIKQCFRKTNGAVNSRKGYNFHQHVLVDRQIISPLENVILSGRKLAK